MKDVISCEFTKSRFKCGNAEQSERVLMKKRVLGEPGAPGEPGEPGAPGAPGAPTGTSHSYQITQPHQHTDLPLYHTLKDLYKKYSVPEMLNFAQTSPYDLNKNVF